MHSWVVLGEKRLKCDTIKSQINNSWVCVVCALCFALTHSVKWHHYSSTVIAIRTNYILIWFNDCHKGRQKHVMWRCDCHCSNSNLQTGERESGKAFYLRLIIIFIGFDCCLGGWLKAMENADGLCRCDSYRIVLRESFNMVRGCALCGMPSRDCTLDMNVCKNADFIGRPMVISVHNISAFSGCVSMNLTHMPWENCADGLISVTVIVRSSHIHCAYVIFHLRTRTEKMG